MEFHDEDFKVISDWFAAKGIRLKCPECGNSTSIEIERAVGTVPVLHDRIGLFGLKDTPGVQGAEFPFVVLICNNCGYTRFFNALTIGVLDATRRKKGGDE